MKFSVMIPMGVITPGEFQTAEAIREMAVALEAAGADACCVTDHPAPVSEWLHRYGHDELDPFTGLAFAAAATTRLRVHTHIVNLSYRQPFITAKAAATLQVLSGGRLILGVGVGYQSGEFEALGADFVRRGARADEALEVLRRTWSGGPITFDGSDFSARSVEPRPVPDPPPTLWVGGGSERAVQRAARWGDGWSPFFAAPGMSKINRDSAIHSIDQLREKIARLAELRAGLGRDGPFDVIIGPSSHDDTVGPRLTHKNRSRAEAQQYLDVLGRLAEVGVTWATLEPSHASRSEYLENISWFGEEVLRPLKRV